MAARENQGLQIALIIFAILTVALGVTTYVFFDKFQEVKDKEAKTATAARNAQAESDNAKAETADLKILLGAEPGEGLKDIQERHVKDMEAYGKTLPQAKRHYRQLVEYIATQVRTKDGTIVTQEDQKGELTGKLKSNETERTTEVKKYSDQADATAKDKDAEREKFNADREKFKAEAAALAKTVEDQRKKLEDDVKKLREEAAALTADVKKLAKERDTLLSIKERNEGVSKVIDGRITWVNQRERLVWLDLGSADGLRQQVSFSVLAGDSSDPTKPTEKGSVEVIEVRGPHVSVARISDDEDTHPILPGDKVLSAAWEAGAVTRFALVGFMDLDGDDFSDRPRIRDLVKLNGGEIDAELSDEGEPSGDITVSTDYLVLGERPNEADIKRAQEAGKDLLKHYTRMIDQAQKSGVKTINVKDFLKLVGYDAKLRSIPLGKDARPSDFRPTLPDGIQRRANGAVLDFPPRKPPGGRGSAGSGVEDK